VGLTPRFGPLAGVKVLELGGIGPGPFAGMVLTDLGANVLRIDPPGEPRRMAGVDDSADLLLRGRPSVRLDLKDPGGLESARRLAHRADVLIDPFRPGVTERLGLGPERLCSDHDRLIYARVTGWGQSGPWSGRAGHDINYLGLVGPLAAMGRANDPPAPPLNLIADFGGGGMLVVLGIAAALYERASSGRGQVIDAAMVDGVSLMFAGIQSFRAMGFWSDRRERNILDGGAPYYDTYATADGRFVAVGALEPWFYSELLERLGLDPAQWPQDDRDRWPELRRALTETFATRARDEWAELFSHVDACVSPVLDAGEVASHPQALARDLYVEVDGVLQAAPAPRFSRTPGAIRPRAQATSLLAEWDLSG
jgi:alpha-methylacyl-CoA racemase